jgi:hypothetical protein
MPQLKGRSPKEEFFERGRQLLDDAENSKDPALAKLRAKAAKRYFAQDVLGTAKVSPALALFLGVAYVICATGVCIYGVHEFDKGAIVGVLIVCILFALILLLFLFALTGVMTEGTIAKVIVRMWDKVLAKLKPETIN